MNMCKTAFLNSILVMSLVMVPSGRIRAEGFGALAISTVALSCISFPPETKASGVGLAIGALGAYKYVVAPGDAGGTALKTAFCYVGVPAGIGVLGFISAVNADSVVGGAAAFTGTAGAILALKPAGIALILGVAKYLVQG